MATKKIQILDYNIKQSENSDTLDGKHASDFASASDMTTAKSNIGELQTKVGDKSVSSQISTAIASKADTDHTHTKSEVGLGNVDNTADADKSVKYATSAGSADSITGVVDIAHGGTGASTRSASLCALINGGREFTGDINTLTDTGVYWINLSNCTNGPASSGYGTMEVISYEVFLQRFTFYDDGTVYCRTYTNSQWYDWRKIFGDKSIVPISSGGTEANNATDARVNLGAASNAVEYFAPYYGASHAMDTDLMYIGIGEQLSSEWNRDSYIGTEDASTLTNSPVKSGAFYGYRKVYKVYSPVAKHYKTIVEIHEAFPKRGRTWTAIYDPNNGWDGWFHNYTNADAIPVSNGGTGASNSFSAQVNLNMVHAHDISASNQNDWRTQALAQIAENAKACGFQCGSIGWAGIQYGQYFATTSGGIADRILALIYNSAGTNYALEVWRYEAGTWNACAVKGASLQTMPIDGYGTADQRPAAGLPGRIYFQKV